MAENETINVGIIGLGRAGMGMHVPELRSCEGFRIVAGCDAIAERPGALADEFGSRCYADYRELLADGEVELVVVATRSNTHVEVGVAALEAGKHVLIEKPLAADLAGADELIEAAAGARTRLLVRHNRRFDPDFLHVKGVIDSGVLGDVFEVRLCRHGFNRRNDWQTLRRFAGGQLNNWGPHVIDHALQFLCGEVESVFADLRRVVACGDAEDHVKIILKGKCGVLVDIEISGAVALGEPAYRVMGSCGSLVCDGEESHLKWFDPAQAPPLDLHPETPAEDAGFGNPEQLPWQEKTLPARPSGDLPRFYDLVYRTLRRGDPFPVTLEQSRQVMWVIEQARRASPF